MRIEVDLVKVDNGQPVLILMGGQYYELKVPSATIPENKPRTRHRRSRPNGLVYNKTYGKWIAPEDITMVSRAITHVENGYTPSTENIIKQTGFSVQKVHAVLNTMRGRGIVESRRNKKKVMIHRLKEATQ